MPERRHRPRVLLRRRGRERRTEDGQREHGRRDELEAGRGADEGDEVLVQRDALCEWRA